VSTLLAEIDWHRFDWQTVAAGALVGVAVLYLARRYWKAWTSREKKACGGCGTCSAREPLPIVTLNLPGQNGSRGEAGPISQNSAQKKASGTA
jgi:hypothetical protein